MIIHGISTGGLEDESRPYDAASNPYLPAGTVVDPSVSNALRAQIRAILRECASEGIARLRITELLMALSSKKTAAALKASRPKTPARGAADFRGALMDQLERFIEKIPEHFDNPDKAFGAVKAYEKVRVYARTFKVRARRRKGGL